MPWEAPPQIFLTGNTAGTTHLFGPVVTLQGGAHITLSGSGNQIVISGAAGGAGGGAALSAGTQSTDGGTVVFANSNGLTFGMSGSSQITGSYTVPSTTQFLTTARASNDAIGLNTAKSNVTWTVNSSGLSFDARGYAGTVTGATSASVTANSGGISVAVGPYITTARASTDAVGLNTAKTNVTWTVNSSGLSLNAGGYAGTGTAATNATITLDTSGLSISVAAPGAGGGIGLNTAQTNVTWTVNSSGLSLNAGGYAGTGTAATNASVTLDTSGLSISVAAPGGGAGPGLSWFEVIPGEILQSAYAATATQFSNRPVFVPFKFPGTALPANTVRFLASGLGSSNTLSLVVTVGVGFYTVNASTRIDLVSSTSNGFSQTASARWNGLFVYDVTGLSAFNLTQGQWVLGMYISATATANMNLRIYGASNLPAIVGFQSAGGSSATGATSNIIPFWGALTGVSGFPNNVLRDGDINCGNSQFTPDLYVAIKGA